MPAQSLRRRARRLAVVVIAGGSAALGAPAALATQPGDNGRLAFVESHPGQFYLEAVMPNGSSGRSLGTGLTPAWSPDGSALAKSELIGHAGECFSEDLTDVFVGSADGRESQPFGAPDSGGPTWSPDGSRVAYGHLTFAPPSCWFDPEAEESGIWIAERDGSNKRQISSDLSYDLDWSPDGKSLLLTRNVAEGDTSTPRIFAINVDGSGLRQLTRDYGLGASWSPDGRRIVYSGRGDTVRIMNADGSADTELTSGSSPVWAPDGKTIAFAADGVYLIDPLSKKAIKAFTNTCDLYDECNAYDPPGLSSAPEDWQPLPLGSNLLGNASFERDVRGWGSFGGALVRVSLGGAPDGAYVAKATRASGATKFSISDGQGGFKETIPFTSASESYVGSVQVKAASSSSVGKPVTVYLREKSPSGATVRESKVASALSSSWKRIAVSAKVSGTGNSLGLRVEQTSGESGNAFYGDAFSLTKARQQVGPATAGGQFTTMGGDSKRVSLVNVDTDFDAVRLRAYLDGKGGTSGSQSVRGVIYTDASGAPGARVGSTSPVSIAAGRAAGWVDFELSAPVALRAYTSYWIGLHSSTPSAVARWAGTSKAGALRFNTDAYSDGAASSFGTPRTDDKEMSLQVVGG